MTRSGVPFFFILFLKQYRALANSGNDDSNPSLRRRLEEPQCHHSAKYHTHMTLGQTCTNDNVYPAPWDQPPMSERFFMNTAAECCNFYFPGKSCNTINVCGDKVPEGTPTTPTGTTAVPTKHPTNRPTKVPGEIPTSHKNDACHPEKKWHADITLGKDDAGCVNNDVFPPGWDKPPLNEKMFFNDAKSCCDHFFEDRSDCEWVDVCAAIGSSSTTTTTSSVAASGSTVVSTTSTTSNSSPYTYPENSPCYGRKWHPDTAKIVNTCTNDLSYPSAWNNGIMDGITMFEDPTSCCAKLIKTNGGECVIVEDTVCLAATASPTRRPTNAPTNAGGGECSSKWHPDEAFQGCTNSGPGTYPPQWDGALASRYMFDTFEACCSTPFFSPDKECVKTDLCPPPPVDCSTLKWHPTSKFDACSNSDEYPADWDNPALVGKFMFSSYYECCEGQFSGRSCPKEDVCNANPCEDNYWHPTTDFQGTCSNSLDFPSEWRQNPGFSKYMFMSFEQCCLETFSGQQCSMEDICNPSSCEDQKWHPTSKFDACSNSMEYPSDWNNPAAAGKFMFSSYNECCSSHFAGKSCPKEDVCNPTTTTSCEDQMWHPTTDFKSCSNDLTFPPSWSQPPASLNYMHQTYDACCAAMFFGRECPKKDVCNAGSSTTKKPTRQPTAIVSTHAPTRMNQNSTPTMPSLNPITETKQPTIFPTSESPTTSPIVCQTAKWHPGLDGYCSNSPEYNALWDMPSLSKIYLHDTHASCCRLFYDKRVCGKEDVCEQTSDQTAHPSDKPSSNPTPQPSHKPFANPTTQPSRKPSSFPIQNTHNDINICKLKKYHPMSVFNRKCTNDANFPPLWSSTSSYFFDSPQDCCASFYNDGWGTCETEDICLSQDRTPSDIQDCGKKWHPTTETSRVCSNGAQYPPVWDSMADQFFFDSAEACCKAFYSSGSGQCDVVNTC